MKTFSYNPKTEIYEFRCVDTISADEVKVLKFIKENQVARHGDIRRLFGDTENSQRDIDTTHHLDHLCLIEWENERNTCVEYNAKDFKKSKYEKISGYFLTENGKAFLNAVFPEPKKKNVKK